MFAQCHANIARKGICPASITCRLDKGCGHHNVKLSHKAPEMGLACMPKDRNITCQDFDTEQ